MLFPPVSFQVPVTSMLAPGVSRMVPAKTPVAVVRVRVWVPSVMVLEDEALSTVLTDSLLSMVRSPLPRMVMALF